MCISVREFLQCLCLLRAWSVELPASMQAVNTLEAVFIENAHLLVCPVQDSGYPSKQKEERRGVGTSLAQAVTSHQRSA